MRLLQKRVLFELALKWTSAEGKIEHKICVYA